ncbi:MAG: hypothetical protein WAM69_06785 [Candidatus Sulfotelmatobacter sp.]
MKTTQAWGWLAAGVLALGLNGFYQDGGLAPAHRIVDGAIELVAGRSGDLVELASERGERLAERASLVAAWDETASCRLAATVARFQRKTAWTQSRAARIEAMSARQEAAVARVEAERARIEARVARVRMVPVAFGALEIPLMACPRVRVNAPRLSVPPVPVVRIPAPGVRVETVGGPI